MDLLRLVNLFGVSVFAASGALKGREKNLDLIGVLTLGVVTATGGGVMYDLILGRIPPFVFRDELILAVALVVSGLCLVVRIPVTALAYFDAVGLGFFTAMATHHAEKAGLPPVPCILVALTGAVGGGVLREILVNDVPFIFRGTLYATASILGAAVLLAARAGGASDRLSIGAALVTTTLLRVLAIRFNWQLPPSKPPPQ